MNINNNYILFVDESGKSKFSDEGSHFLLSGLIINKDLHVALSNYMVSLKEKSGIPTKESLHAFEIFEREKLRDQQINYQQIDTFFKRLSYLIDGADVRPIIFRIDKTPFKKLITKVAKTNNVTERAVINYLRRWDLDDFLYESVARRVILEFGYFLEREDAQGEVMAESRRNDDETVLKAFISATNGGTFKEGSRYRNWAQSAFKRIHSLSFQNKKGLSFGLEIADLFGWAHLNTCYGRTFPIDSMARRKRAEKRIKIIDTMTKGLCRKKPEDITKIKLNNVANDRVSEFTEALKEFKGPRLV